LRASLNRESSRNNAPKRGEATGAHRKLHDEELHNLYSSPDIIRVIKDTYDAQTHAKSAQNFWGQNPEGILET
jgi:hypothetical protein